MQAYTGIIKFFIGIILIPFTFGTINLAFTEPISENILMAVVSSIFLVLFIKWVTPKKHLVKNSNPTDIDLAPDNDYIEVYEGYEDIEDGILPTVKADNILLKKNEMCHYIEDATLVTSKTVIAGYQGGSSGVSVRVMKGVTVRGGSSKGVPIREEEVTKHKGILYITSKRAIFASPSKSFNTALDKISSINPYTDGIGICVNNAIYNILLDTPDLALDVIKVAVSKLD